MSRSALPAWLESAWRRLAGAIGSPPSHRDDDRGVAAAADHAGWSFAEFPADAPLAPRLWVADGAGAAPFGAALRRGPCAVPTTLVYLHRGRADAVVLAELRLREAADPLFLLVAQAGGWGEPDLATALARVDALSSRQVHVCGSARLMHALRRQLREVGMAASAIRAWRS